MSDKNLSDGATAAVEAVTELTPDEGAAAEAPEVDNKEYEYHELPAPEVAEEQGPDAGQMAADRTRLQQELQQTQGSVADLTAKLNEAIQANQKWQQYAETLQQGSGGDDWGDEQRPRQQALPSELDPVSQALSRIEEMENRLTQRIGEVEMQTTQRDVRSQVEGAISALDAEHGTSEFIRGAEVARVLQEARRQGNNTMTIPQAAKRAYKNKVEWARKNNLMQRKEKPTSPPPFPQGPQGMPNPQFERGEPIKSRDDLPNRIGDLIDQIGLVYPESGEGW